MLYPKLNEAKQIANVEKTKVKEKGNFSPNKLCPLEPWPSSLAGEGEGERGMLITEWRGCDRGPVSEFVKAGVEIKHF